MALFKVIRLGGWASEFGLIRNPYLMLVGGGGEGVISGDVITLHILMFPAKSQEMQASLETVQSGNVSFEALAWTPYLTGA